MCHAGFPQLYRGDHVDDLLQEFIAETRETLDALSGEIVAWEADPADRGRLDAIFRFVHTVKGSCGFLDLPRLARLSHAAEDVLAAVRDGARTPDRALVNAVLAVVDRIGALVEAIDAQVALDDGGEDKLIAALAEGQEVIVQAPGPTGQRAAARSVRLNVDLLDRMMSGMSDMVLARNELARRVRDEHPDTALEAALERMSATVADLRETVTRTRMQKIEALFSALPRMVRDTAAGLGKSVTLHIDGSEVELDREMIEVMRDPLVHIIRNSIDHGIEAPAFRRMAGKRENGKLTVSARQSGNQIIVEIVDDGAGIDTERLIAKLAASGRDPHALRSLSHSQKLDLIFEPGLSSKDEVTEVSGRGVGMDVVRAAIEQIGGRIELDSETGRGLRITIHVPLTLSIIPTIVVGVGDQRFAIPRQAIEEIVSEAGQSIRIDQVGNSALATIRDRRLPLVELATTLRLVGTFEPRMLVVIGIGNGSYVLAVDSVHDTEELVIKPAAPMLMASGIFAGQTLPDNGRPMLMLDCAGIASDAGLQFVRVIDVVEDDAAPEVAGIAALLFRDLDDTIRAVPLDVVDRVESVDSDRIAMAAGVLRLTVDGTIVSLVAIADIGDRAAVGVIRMTDGKREIGYVIAEALDIVMLPEERGAPSIAGMISGVALVAGQPVELLDPFWLFADEGASAGGSPPNAAPVCLIDPADAWMHRFVAPMLTQAGYRVVDTLAPNESAGATLVLGDTGSAHDEATVRLRTSPVGSDDSIYRYDRARILAAVAARTAGARA